MPPAASKMMVPDENVLPCVVIDDVARARRWPLIAGYVKFEPSALPEYVGTVGVRVVKSDEIIARAAFADVLRLPELSYGVTVPILDVSSDCTIETSGITPGR